MHIPLQVTLHGIPHSRPLYDTIRDRARGLERYYDRLIVPGGEIAVTHEHGEDPQVAVRDAFDAARRQLEDYARVQRGD